MATNAEIEKLAQEMRREYKRDWARKNRDKRRSAENRYWMKKAKERLESEEELAND